MNDLIKILKMTESELKKYVYNYLINMYMKPVNKSGFVYAEGEIPVLLVAHLDTVFKRPPETVLYDNEHDMMTATRGLGGDDRCGVFAILKILEELKPHVLFTEQEEVGGLGAKKALSKLKRPNVKYMIEFDRHGDNDCVFYDCGNTEFINYIESFGFKTEIGVFSDISILGPSWDIATVNISSGYYDEHTYHEYIKVNELLTNIERVKKILKESNDVKYFDYQEKVFQINYENNNLSNIINTKEYDLLFEIFNYPIKNKSRVLKNK